MSRRWLTICRRRPAATAAAVVLLGAVAVDHLRPHDDRSRYNHRTLTVAAVPAGDTLQLGDGTRVRLLGLCDPAAEAVAHLGGLVGRRVTLLLPPVGLRDGDGCLRAYAFADDGTCLNVALVKDGLAYADRRTPDAMAGLIDPAENDARRHGRGLWAGLRFDHQPAWRQAWLGARAAARRP